MLNYTFIHRTGAELTLFADSEELATKEFEDIVLHPADWYLEDEESFFAKEYPEL